MERRKRILSEQEAYIKLSALCATAEYCIADVQKKMNMWELSQEGGERVLKRLLEEKYIDESRYAHAFTRDKFRYNHWGMVRIAHELRMKNIDAHLIQEAREDIEDEEYLDTLRKIIETKKIAQKVNRSMK